MKRLVLPQPSVVSLKNTLSRYLIRFICCPACNDRARVVRGREMLKDKSAGSVGMINKRLLAA